MWRKGNHPLHWWNVNWCSHYGKLKIELPYNPTSGHVTRGKHGAKEYTYPRSSSIHNSQDMKTTETAGRKMDKEGWIHTHTHTHTEYYTYTHTEYYSAIKKNKIMPSAAIRM